ncbi:glutathione binding-like protein [Acinetobacter johnsonii]|uniref:glutathione binding-like protein n=1 Tax=Acinetobacter johnsonii TaxID=40214 RepID=UPI001F27DDF3|nr:glutathione binding-like protein [Acinetobacter johnsonii]UIP94079.1 glutathione binding-like protein [Acinetobacter johnsonii]
MILHHLQNSRSQRILWLLEELELSYELKLYYTAQAKQTNLKFPTLDISHNTQTIRLTESSAIIEYLCQLCQKLIILHDHTQYWNFCFYSHYSDASLMPNLALKQVFQHIKQQTPLVVRFVSLAFQSAFNHAYLNPELDRQLKEIDIHLSTHAYFAGDVFSYADILMWFPLYAASYATPQFTQYHAIQYYFTQIQSRPAFNAAMARGQWSASYFEHYWSITQ